MAEQGSEPPLSPPSSVPTWTLESVVPDLILRGVSPYSRDTALLPLTCDGSVLSRRVSLWEVTSDFSVSLDSAAPPALIPLGGSRRSFVFLSWHFVAQHLGPPHPCRLRVLLGHLVTHRSLASARLSGSCLATLPRSFRAPRPFLPLCLCSFFTQGLGNCSPLFTGHLLIVP